METRHATGSLKDQLEAIRQRVAAGDPVADAMKSANGYFPPMFVQMVEVGESTGKLDEVLLRLAQHYEHQVQMKRTFWIGIAWPLFELIFAVLVIGFLIFILGLIGSGQTIFGIPMGTGTALVWFMLCGLVATLIALTAQALTRGWLGPQPVLLAMKIPVLGKSLESLALSRLTWSLALSLDSGMDARKAVELSIRATQNPFYEASLAEVTGNIRANKEFHESFRAAGIFPEDFVNSLEAAELAGATTESLLRLAQQYEDRARTALRILTALATVGVMLLVFGVIIFAIFTLFFELYMKPINEALEWQQSGRP
jgi:type II secretory pathway component PulF